MVSFHACQNPQTGGFETYDLQALIRHPDGTPVASARVWLVRSRGDSAPAQALDSSWTDNQGVVRFASPSSSIRGLGLDVQKADSLAIGVDAFDSGARATIHVAPARKISLAADSLGTQRCFVPGSHFSSVAESNGSGSSLSLPEGTWKVAFSWNDSAPTVRTVAISRDTVFAVTPDPPKVDTTVISSLSNGPTVYLDSFQVDGKEFFRDLTFLPRWVVREDTFPSVYFSRTLVDTTRSDSIILSSKSGRFAYRGDSATGQFISEILTENLPLAGYVGLEFMRRDRYSWEPQTKFIIPPAEDSGFFLQLSLRDIAGAGARITLDSRAQHIPDSFLVRSEGSARVVSNQTGTPEECVNTIAWFLSWTRDSIWIRNGKRLGGKDILGVVALDRPMIGQPSITVTFGSSRLAPASMVSIRQARLYTTR